MRKFVLILNIALLLIKLSQAIPLPVDNDKSKVSVPYPLKPLIANMSELIDTTSVTIDSGIEKLKEVLKELKTYEKTEETYKGAIEQLEFLINSHKDEAHQNPGYTEVENKFEKFGHVMVVINLLDEKEKYPKMMEVFNKYEIYKIREKIYNDFELFAKKLFENSDNSIDKMENNPNPEMQAKIYASNWIQKLKDAKNIKDKFKLLTDLWFEMDR